jgi:hypothetical protein
MRHKAIGREQDILLTRYLLGDLYRLTVLLQAKWAALQ